MTSVQTPMATMTNWATPASQCRSNQSVIQSTAPNSAKNAAHQRYVQKSGRGHRWARASRWASHAIRVLIVALFAAVPAFAQGTLAPVAQQVFLDASGNVINGGKLCTYEAGTTTAQATYYNQDLDVSHVNSNPVILNSAGRPTTGGVYLLPTSYKFVLLTAGSDSTCATGTTIYTQDQISAIPSTTVALDVDGTAGEALTIGDVVYLSDGSGALTAGRWYKADADNTYSSSTAASIGVATTTITSGDAGTIRLGGRVTGLSGLVAGERYYVSAVAAALTATPPTNAWMAGKADSTTSLILIQNQGAVCLPDSDGTHQLCVRTSSNLTADRLITLVPGDGARSVTLSADLTVSGTSTINQDVSTAGAPSFNWPGPCQGRLTGTTGTPVTTADVTGAGTIYFTPTDGARCAVYDGAATWVDLTFAEITIALTCTASKPYDVFVYNNAGTLAYETLVWTNDTTRATAVSRQNGVWVKTGTTTRRLVGSFYCNASANQTDDSFAKRNICNADIANKVNRQMRVLDTTDTWTYSTSTFQQARANAANQLEFLACTGQEELMATVVASASSDAASQTLVAIGIDSTTTAATGATQSMDGSSAASERMNPGAHVRTYPGVGRHLAVWLEWANGGTVTWFGDNGGGQMQSAIIGEMGL